MTNSTAPALRFHRWPIGLYARGADLGYTVSKVDGRYRLRIWALVEIDGDRFLDRVIEMAYCEKQGEAKALACAFEALGEDYDRSAHGGKERLTEAVCIAFA